MKTFTDFWTAPWEQWLIIFMSSMKSSKTVFCVQLYIMPCYWLVLNRCLIPAETVIYGTEINKPRYAAIKEIENWHRKQFQYFRRNLLYLDIFMPKISVKEIKKKVLKARKVIPLLHLVMVGGFISFSNTCALLLLILQMGKTG